ncbi:substrate-binding periplasmic protein [Raineya orbicola]|jgi:putative glutamine transport system substrate-binding protein|uniref:Bacterial extracellular solute-binding protein, family 3 n=1 Tax=Raineya orbicola TaxID=2016530 RepID=A0A2N3II91_9BACT|nr:transporter substrate-binding domain-containing protein [Raineya orbicola]PKQ70045.1 Bacterial extracellular solute-binding protein, family 3 [Raineya orbicola]
MRTIKILLLWLWSISALQAQLQGDSWTNAQKNKEATIIITYFETPRYVYKTADGKLEGICIDILKEFIAYVKRTKNINIKVNIQKPIDNFTLFLQNIKAARGGVFALGPFTITEERKKEMSFTPRYIDNISYIITHNSVPDLTSLPSISAVFRGMKAYALKNSTQEAEILDIKNNYYKDLEIVYVNSADELITKVLSDPKSFTKHDFLYYADALQNGKPIKIHPAGKIQTNPYGFIMPKGSDWTLIWNEFLNETNGFTTRPEYRKILEKHLGFVAVKVLLQKGI